MAILRLCIRARFACANASLRMREFQECARLCLRWTGEGARPHTNKAAGLGLAVPTYSEEIKF